MRPGEIRKLHLAALVLVAITATGSIGFGQQVGSGLAASSTSDGQYEIGPGDVLDIRIFNRPQLSREAVRVDDRGKIRLPLLDEISAACKTEAELSNAIGKAYLEYLKEPHVDVFIKEYRSQPVVVVGAVHEPGRFIMQRRVHLVELISLAGGLTEQAAGKVQVTRSEDQGICGRSNEKNVDEDSLVKWYEFNDLLAAGAGAEIPVRPGDTVNLLEADKAYVIGNVVNPTIVPLKSKVTLSEAIAMAGGTLPDSKLEKLRLTRQSGTGPRKEMTVDLKAISRDQAEDIVLEGNDIIEVRTSTGKRILRGLLNSIVPSATRLPVRVIN